MPATITADDLNTLIQAVLPFAPEDDAAGPINAIRLEATGGKLTGDATDRYKAVQAHQRATGDLAPFLLPTVAAKQLTKLLVGQKSNDTAELDINDDTLTVKLVGITAQFKQASTVDTYPALSTIFGQTENATVALDSVVAVNLKAFAAVEAAIGHIARDGIRMWFTGPLKPIRVEVSDWFAAIIMPMHARNHHGDSITRPTAPFTLPPAGSRPVPLLANPDDVPFPTEDTATAKNVSRAMTMEAIAATHRWNKRRFPDVPPAAEQTPQQQAEVRLHLDTLANGLHAFGVAYLLRELAKVSPKVADEAAKDLIGMWEDGGAVSEWSWEWAVEYGLDPDALVDTSA